ncbi:phage protein GemA/Gp16 family protein [Dyella sp. 20L07]|uniref:phage protein GemA/Gp16 family protein n=1 Tax=Dyella sp. 20L07 TaxID=3384240 RepID=UPI003D28AF1E
MTTARKSSPQRTGQLAMIHIAAQQVGMDDSTYRDMLWTVARVRSSKELDLAGREAVLKHLAACGWKDPRRPMGRTARYEKGSQAALIRYLWTRLHQAGVVEDGSDQALRSFVKQQSQPYHPQRAGYDAPSLLPAFVAGRVIEHLKAWCEREGIAR